MPCRAEKVDAELGADEEINAEKRDEQNGNGYGNSDNELIDRFHKNLLLIAKTLYQAEKEFQPSKPHKQAGECPLARVFDFLQYVRRKPQF